ncbi:TonB family protein [Acidobacteria bacterium AB60]|nr:TonB family protein [Acidobacteria bacterium AB60]
MAMTKNASPVDWVGRLIDKRFPLFEWLGRAESGELFRTELPGPQSQKAAIRLVPAEIEGVQAQFDDWAQAEGLAHPNLLRIFESGRGRIDENEFLYVVMELPEETLAQVLPTRTLTGPEVAEMLPPILSALGYLHGRGLVHGHITPANIHVVGDRVKLSADTLQQSGQLRKLQGGLRVYDAPEVAQGTNSAASDVWSLGITLVEALTQLPPIRNAGTGGLGVPQFMPEPFAEIARRCLRVDPAERASLSDVEGLLRVPATRTAAVPPTAPVAGAAVRPAGSRVAGAAAPVSPTPAAKAAPIPNTTSALNTPMAAKAAPAGPALPGRVEQGELAFEEVQPSRRAMRALDDEPEGHGEGRRSKPSTPAIVGLAALLVVLIAALFIRSHRNRPAEAPEGQASAPASATVAPASPSQPAAAPAHPAAAAGGTNAKGAVLERVMPQISAHADRTIRGRLAVRVRVAVDRDGKVANAGFESAGPSRYFANQALEAARKWRFTPARADGRTVASTWVLRFEFRRGRTDVNPVEVAP